MVMDVMIVMVVGSRSGNDVMMVMVVGSRSGDGCDDGDSGGQS